MSYGYGMLQPGLGGGLQNDPFFAVFCPVAIFFSAPAVYPDPHSFPHFTPPTDFPRPRPCASQPEPASEPALRICTSSPSSFAYQSFPPFPSLPPPPPPPQKVDGDGDLFRGVEPGCV